MYTQCPQCQTVFRVTATMLKAARGKVRCGRCAHVFNALTFLLESDEPPGTHSPGGRADDVQPVAGAEPPSHPQSQSTPSSPSPQNVRPENVKRYDDNTPFEEDEQELAAAPPEEITLDSGSQPSPDFAGGADEEQTGGLELEGADGLSVEEEPLEDASFEEGLLEEEPPDGESLEEELLLEADANPGDEPGEEPAGEFGELQAQDAADDELQDEAPPEEDLPIESTDPADEDVPDAALEFSAADLAQVFVPAPAVSIPRPLEAGTGDETAEHEILDVEMETPAAPEVITLEGDSIVVVEGGPEEETPAAAAGEPEHEAPRPAKPRTQEAIDLEVRREIEKAFADDPTTRAEFILPSGRKVSLHRNQDEIEVEEIEAAEALELDTSRQRRARIAWGAGGVVLAILLAIQVIHYNRQALVQSATIGPLITDIYGAFGSELTPTWKVDAYDVRQWGAAADPRSGTVKVRASVTNGAEHAQPYPLLRLTLMNRFGERLRQSDIEPKDYLTQAPDTGQLLGAGQRVDASIAIVDPGDEAVNFEIDVCLRRNAAVTCASDAMRQRS